MMTYKTKKHFFILSILSILILIIIFISNGFTESKVRITDCLVESNKYLKIKEPKKICIFPLSMICTYGEEIKISETLKTKTLNNKLISEHEAKITKEGYYVSKFPEGAGSREEEIKLTVFIEDKKGFTEHLEVDLENHSTCNNLREEKKLVNNKLFFGKTYKINLNK